MRYDVLLHAFEKEKLEKLHLLLYELYKYFKHCTSRKIKIIYRKTNCHCICCLFLFKVVWENGAYGRANWFTKPAFFHIFVFIFFIKFVWKARRSFLQIVICDKKYRLWSDVWLKSVLFITPETPFSQMTSHFVFSRICLTLFVGFCSSFCHSNWGSMPLA